MISRHYAACAASAIGALTLLSSANAVTINAGTYALGNHPDGNATPPGYGFRLDELFNATGSHDIFTFDFEDAVSNMLLTYDDNADTIRIFGTMFGGLDSGVGYDADWAGTWSVDVTYSNVSLAGTDDDLWNTGNMDPIGSLTLVAGGADVTAAYSGPIGIWSKSNGTFAFRLGDENDDNGHRGYEGISGWGWVNHTVRDKHVASSDWLFTMAEDPIPAPGSAALMATGLLVAGTRRRK